MQRSEFQHGHLRTVLRHCPKCARTYEVGIGTGLAAIRVSLRGAAAEGIDISPVIVERARQANNLLGGMSEFGAGDLFQHYRDSAPRYQVIHYQGGLEHFTVHEIRAAVAQHVALAAWVVFSVPSAYYPFAG